MKPAFPHKNAICFTIDERVVRQLYVVIKSLVDTSSEKNQYDILILHSCENTEILDKIVEDFSAENVSIRYIDAKQLEKEHNFYTHRRPDVTQATFYRLFIPRMFPEYEKILYLDADIIIRSDIQELLDTDLTGFDLGITPDLYHETRTMRAVLSMKYLESIVLNFGAALMLMNIQELNKKDFTGACERRLEFYGSRLRGGDNTIVCDVALYEKLRLKRIDLNWLCAPSVLVDGCYKRDMFYFVKRLPIWYDLPVENFWSNPKLIHYAGDGINKPWNYRNDSFNPYAKYWWEVAEKTPYRDWFENNLRNYPGKPGYYYIPFEKWIPEKYLRRK